MRRRTLVTACASLLLASLAPQGAQADITIDLGRGPVTVHIPDSYDPSVPAPLVVLLHGYSSSGAAMDAWFDLDAQAERFGFVRMAPDGTRDIFGLPFWNATDACCNFYGSNVDDSGYLRALVEEVQNQLNVNSRRIHFVGHSNGGFMCYRMACDHGDLIASISSLAGAAFNDDSLCGRTEPVHTLQIHGTSDSVISYNGGSTGIGTYPSAPGSVRRWALGNGCDDVRDDTCPPIDVSGPIPGDETLVSKWTSNCDFGGSGELWTIVNGFHSPTFASGFQALLAEWMMAHPKPGEWFDLGQGLGGTYGEPVLTGTGTLAPDEPFTLEVTNAREDAIGFFVVGFDELNLPFAGGTLVPTLDFVATGLRTDSLGRFTATSTWPDGFPPRFETLYQFWLLDPMGPEGYAATNAVRGITP